MQGVKCLLLMVGAATIIITTVIGQDETVALQFPNHTNVSVAIGESVELSFYILTHFDGNVEIEAAQYLVGGEKQKQNFVYGDLSVEPRIHAVYRLYGRHFSHTNGTLYTAKIMNNETEEQIQGMTLSLKLTPAPRDPDAVHPGATFLTFNVTFLKEEPTSCQDIPTSSTPVPVQTTPTSTMSLSSTSTSMASSASTSTSMASSASTSTSMASSASTTPCAMPTHSSFAATPTQPSQSLEAMPTLSSQSLEATPIQPPQSPFRSLEGTPSFFTLIASSGITVGLHVVTIILILILLCSVSSLKGTLLCGGGGKPGQEMTVIGQQGGETRDYQPDSDDDIDPRILERTGVVINYDN